MASAFNFLVTMAFTVIFLFLCGLSTLKGSELPGFDFSGEVILRQVDPFLKDKCTDKGVDFERAKEESSDCVKEAIGDHMLKLAGSIVQEGTDGVYSQVCSLQETIEACTKDFIRTLKYCYDDASQKKALETVLKSRRASMDYICKDDARRMKELAQFNVDLKCLALDQERLSNVSNCIVEKQGRFKDLKDEPLYSIELCKVSIEVANCQYEMYSDCESNKPWDIHRGLIAAGLKASPCEPYVDAYLSSAHSILIHYGLLPILAISIFHFYVI